ncbi:MAG: TraR/DksA family transcriptional regulator [Candidatus Omnitrophica bacterium]|nr:TraR/DksA family transcriptional regulator [Candidatus Omnitrophota bacterium]MCA9426263.1 TraR/DksA family transcriptional regulator [Candidatus Omnitrophota bacterium]MCA9431851.1 TraR/DksA family transcriptional regulator [Candidatus Omnitrophota bacterium]MCA9448112.1 TraR/DksA family transcriptional regulator [Candidatus Omnitrophota bacterium]MCB9769778.1 TraR/DksA family transcriptional regulator [Candidatus Omnitrophota bacterium]
MPLTKKQLTELKELLLQEKANLMGIKWNPETDAGFGGDLVDQSTGLTEQELRLELAEHDRERLLEVEEALKRHDEGTYGICLESGEEIPYARLKAVPTAKYTIQCQEMLERRRFIRD